MKKLLLSLLIISQMCRISAQADAAAGSAGAASHERAVTGKFASQATWLLGYFSADMFKYEPHSEWFTAQYDSYKPDDEAVNKLLSVPAGGITIKVVVGTWCPDSRKQTPRFMKLIDMWKYPVSEITFIGVDDAKLSPVGEYEQLDIQRVPTFIFYKNNIEAGRIIENPVTSLEQDMVNILK